MKIKKTRNMKVNKTLVTTKLSEKNLKKISGGRRNSYFGNFYYDNNVFVCLTSFFTKC